MSSGVSSTTSESTGSATGKNLKYSASHYSVAFTGFTGAETKISSTMF